MKRLQHARHGGWISRSLRLAVVLSSFTLLDFTTWAAGTVTVCTEPALRAALAGGGTVTFACDGTITLTKTITNSVDVLLDGSGHQVTISGGDSVRVFCVRTNVSLEIINLTIANGLARRGGGILNLGGKVSLTGVQVWSNTASYDAEPQASGSAAGGGIFNQGGSLHATNCVFLDCSARQQSASSTDPSRTRGGALCNESGEVCLETCSFTSNSVAGAPGPFNIHGTAHEAGGGAVANSGTLEANHCLWIANSAVGGMGGGIGGEGGFANGGGLCNLGFLKLSESTFISNNASGGMGGDGASGFPGNPPGSGGSGGSGGAANGGALFNAGVATVADCSFTGNVGTGGSGGTGGAGYPSYYYGVSGGNGGSGGRGGSACGAICDINALCLLTNCMVSANSTVAGAGGMGGPGGFGNPSGAGGSGGPAGQSLGAFRSVGTIVMNTVFSGNDPGGDCSGTFTDGGRNRSSDCNCGFTNPAPRKIDTAALPPFYLLHNFTGQETSYVDAHPFASLIAAADGSSYGVTTGDAWPGAGCVFKINTNGTDSSFAVLKGFGTDPTYGPAGALALSGNVLFGTTVRGGVSNLGTIFKINTDGSGYAILHHFTGAGDGAQPWAGLVLSGSTLFGTTSYGGISNYYGTIFKIETNGSGYAILKHFTNGTNGCPASELLCSGATLYGTTIGSGYPGGSTVFKINTDGSGYAILKYFDAAGDCWSPPSAGLAISGSTLFGSTVSEWWGQSGCGMIFKVNTDGSDFSVLRQFPGTDAPGRHASLIFADGKLYGTTRGDGGQINQGSVFMMNTDGNGYTVLRQFNGADGIDPNGSLALIGRTLFGTTMNGGFYGSGVAFAISISPPAIVNLPSCQTAELGDTVGFTVEATGFPPPSGQWFFNATNLVPDATGFSLTLGATQYCQSGSYTLVLSNALGAVTSAPVVLNIVAPVERRLVPGLWLWGDAGSSLNLECADALGPAVRWTTMDSVNLVSAPQLYCDLATQLPQQRFYRAWQAGVPAVAPTLNLNFFPAIVLSGAVGNTVRVDCINAIGPTDAWVTLDTVTLTNSSQLYVDATAVGQPMRIYRIMPEP